MSDTSTTDVTTDLVQNTGGGKEVEVIEEGGDVVQRAIDDLAAGRVLAYSSLTGTDWATKLAQLNAVTSSAPIRDHLNEVIVVRNIIVQAIDITNPETGVVSRQPRIIVLDDENTAYHAVSQGLMRSLINIIGILGQPSTWQSGVPLKFVKRDAKGPGQYMTVEMANTYKVGGKSPAKS